MSPPPVSHPPVTLSEGDGVRYLHLGSVWVQGAMRIRSPQFVHLDYVQRMLASLLWLDSAAVGQGQALQLGLGAGAITRFTRGSLGMPTTVVELNPWVIEVCRRYFRIDTDDKLLQMICADAGAWLRAQQLGGLVQLLHVDLYDHEAAAPVLDDVDFYAHCRRMLAPGGVMSVNLFGRRSSYADSAAKVAAVFGTDQVWSLQPTREGNTALIAGRDVVVPAREVLQARAESIEKRFAAIGLQASKWLRMVRPYRADTALAEPR